MSGQSTQNFLNTLRVAGRMWGSHGDKITNAAQGRNYDDERAARKQGLHQAIHGGAVSPVGGGIVTGAGDNIDGGAVSPIMRQVSRDFVVSPSSPFFTRQSSNVGSGRDGATSPSILRQTSREAFGNGGNTSPLPPPLIARQASRDLPLVEIVRQHSRDLGGGVTSPTNSNGGGGGSGRNSPNTFRPIGGVPGSPSGGGGGGGSNRGLSISTSPVSLLVPILPAPTSPTAAALRPTFTRGSSQGGGLGGGGGGGANSNRASSLSPTSPLGLRPKVSTQLSEDIVPVIPAAIMGEASKDLIKRDNAAHGAEKAAAKAVQNVEATGKEGDRQGGIGGEGGGGGPAAVDKGDDKTKHVQLPPATELSTTEKADLVRTHRKKSSLGTSLFGRGGRKKSGEAAAAATATTTTAAAPASAPRGKSLDASDGSNGKTESTTSGGGGKWRPGHFFRLRKGEGNDNESGNRTNNVEKEP